MKGGNGFYSLYNMNNTSDQLDLLLMESQMILEEAEDKEKEEKGEETSTDSESGFKGFLKKAADWFKKIFNMIRDTLVSIKNKILARLVNLRKAFAKTASGVDRSTKIKFVGADLVNQGNVSKIIESINNIAQSISTAKADDFTKIDTVKKELESFVGGDKEAQKKAKATVSTVGALGAGIDGLDKARNTFKTLTKEAKNRQREAQIALAGAEKNGREDAKKQVELEKKRASHLNKIVNLFTRAINKLAAHAIAGISAIKKAKGKSKDEEDTKEDEKVEESFFFADFDSEFDDALYEGFGHEDDFMSIGDFEDDFGGDDFFSESSDLDSELNDIILGW